MLPIITIEGRVVADPELRFGSSGVAVTKVRLVASSRKKEGDDWVDDKTLWIDCTCFKQLAENVAESIAKGDLVTVVGKLQTDEWEDRDTGQKRQKTVVIANNVSASLQFRTIRHGEGKTTRSSGGSAQASEPTADPWAGGSQSDEPPF